MQRLHLVRPFEVEVKAGLVRFSFAEAPKNKGYELSMSATVARILADELNKVADELDPEG